MVAGTASTTTSTMLTTSQGSSRQLSLQQEPTRSVRLVARLRAAMVRVTTELCSTLSISPVMKRSSSCLVTCTHS